MVWIDNILWFVISVGILVVFHELGHYLVGRFFNVKVLRFSIGFGKPIFSRSFGRDKTLFSIGAIPLGGFVDFLGMRENRVSQNDDDRAFYRQNFFAKAAIVTGGPCANFLLAIFLYSILFVMGVPSLKPILDTPTSFSAASQTDLQRGDEVKKVNNERVENWQQLRWKILENMHNSEISLEVQGTDGALRLTTLNTAQMDFYESDTDIMKSIGLSPIKYNLPAVIGELIEGGGASRAGLKAGDEILEIDAEQVKNFNHLVKIVSASAGMERMILIDRDGQLIRVPVNIDSVDANGEVVGRLGVKAKVPEVLERDLLVRVEHSVPKALAMGVVKTWDISVFSLKMIGRMLVGDVSLSNLSGPVTIADYAGKTANFGIASFIGFLALVSISLGVINLLPIPVLDGGWLVFLTIEAVKGSAIPEKAFVAIQSVGLGLIGTIFVLAIYNDVIRLYSN